MRPRLRRLTAAAGAVCLTLSAICLLSDGALRAAPLLAVRLHLPFPAPRLALDAPAPAPPPAATGAPTPEPHRRRLLGEGPIVLKGNGTYQLALTRSSRNGSALANDNYSTALSLVAERRTEQSSLSVSSAFGYGGGNLSAGSLIAGYRTTRYGLTYGQVSGPSDTQLQIGGFARGLSLSIPVRNGDITYLAATAQQGDSTTYRVYGLRRSWNALGGYLAAAQFYGIGEQGGGRESITDLSYRRYGAKLSTDTEVAVSSIHGVGNAPDGMKLATAFHADLQGKTTFTTLGLRFDPAGFQSLTGTVEGGFNGDLAIRRHSERFGDIDLNLGHSDQHLAGSAAIQHDNRLTLSGGKSWNTVGMQYVAGLDGTSGEGVTTLQRTGALTFTETLRGFSLVQTLQATSTSGSSGTATQNQIALGAGRQMLGGSVAYQYARSGALTGSSSGSAVSQSFSYRRSVGKKLDVQLGESIQTSTNNGATARLIDTSVSLVRRLSNVVAVQVTGHVFQQSGLGGGSGSGIQASLVGPFGFGQPRGGYGRANPNLPAVIRGIVTYSAASNPFSYNASTIRGYNNALVVLDGRVTQRTDANGEFEFRFVSQGAHSVRIDPATIQPGLITDREYQTVQVLGGQTTTIQFNVGNFAGISGSVLTTDANGKKRGLANVGISVDGIQAVSTAPDGHYAIGRLSPGAHTVQIVESTLPSTVAPLGDTKKTVTVTAGTSIPLNFVTTPLGTISGMVVAPADGGFGQLSGLRNVYVVAEPGEHAVITNDDGSFILDNMVPGSYTLTVDPDTVPDGLSVISGPEGPVALGGGATLSGLIFRLGAAPKQVVYTFSDGRRTPIQVTTDPALAAPGALLHVIARTNAKDVKTMFVESDVFGGFPLRLDSRAGAWTGTVLVPSLAKGDYAISVTAHRKDVTDASVLVPVDPAVPLFALRVSPRNAQPGHSIRVTLKTLAPVEEGDTLIFEDGYKMLLPKPAGRLFAFDMRLWRKGLPYTATLTTKRGPTYPIILR